MSKKSIKRDRNSYLLIGGIILYGIVIAAFFLIIMPKDKNNVTHNYLIIDGEHFYEYDNDYFKTVSFLDMDFNNQMFKLYRDYNYSGEYYVSNVSSEYQHIKFTKGKTDHALIPNIPYIAMTDAMSYVEFEKKELTATDINNILELMADKGFDSTTTLYASYKVNIDVDSDGVDEVIYVISNFDYMEVQEKMFSIIFIEDNNGMQILEEYYFDKDDYMEFIRCDLIYILDLNLDGKYTLVVSNSDDDSTINNFYIKDGNYYKNLRLS